jgi:hypothetical protein
MKVMTQPAEVVTVQVPFKFVKRGGRKEIQLPAGAPRQCKPDSTLVKALARAFRWKKMIESGEYTNLADLAAREKIAPTYLNRVLRLTLLAPEIVERIVEGRCAFVLAEFLEPFAELWEGQLENRERN